MTTRISPRAPVRVRGSVPPRGAAPVALRRSARSSSSARSKVSHDMGMRVSHAPGARCPRRRKRSCSSQAYGLRSLHASTRCWPRGGPRAASRYRSVGCFDCAYVHGCGRPTSPDTQLCSVLSRVKLILWYWPSSCPDSLHTARAPPFLRL